MAISHVKSSPVADMTGTITVFNSAGNTTTAAATNLIRPSDWNTAHNFFQTISGNTAGQSTASGTNLVIGGTGVVTVSLSTEAGAATLFVSGGQATLSGYDPYRNAMRVAGAHGAGTLHVQPIDLPDPVAFDRFVMPIIFSGATNSTGSGTLSMSVGVYTQTGGSISLLGSVSGSWAVTHSGTANSSSNVGNRMISMGTTGTLSAGNYYFGVWSRTTSGGANVTFSQHLQSQMASAFPGFLGEATNASFQTQLGCGYFSASFSTGMPAVIAFSQIQGTTSIHHRPPVGYFAYSTV